MAALVLDDEVKQFLEIADNADDALIGAINLAASDEVRQFCGRSFTVDPAQAATTRVFQSLTETLCMIDDAWSITLVESDSGNDGTYATDWTSSQWYAWPANGISQTGETGWPYTHITSTGSLWFPIADRPNVRVTGKWGWAALPDSVRLAHLQLCGELYRSRTGGYDTFTTDGGFTTIRSNRVVRDLLQPYRRSTAADGRFVVG
jgi:hypothetical protein